VRGNMESDGNTRTQLGDNIAPHVYREVPTMGCKAGMASAPQQNRFTAPRSAAVPRETRANALANASARPRETRSAGLRAAAMLAGAAICGWGELERRSGLGREQQSLTVATTASGAAGAAMDEPFLPAKTQAPVASAPTPRHKLKVRQPLPGRDGAQGTREPTQSRAIASKSEHNDQAIEKPPQAVVRGPFFGPTDVTESPRIVSRVEPKVPPQLRHQSIDDVVVVRLLVSQVGEPSRVSVLRHAKLGAPVDDAVIAAINQWTFSPARKKGEAVSSWFNVGVPIRSNG
jgi:TonB family protein